MLVVALLADLSWGLRLLVDETTLEQAVFRLDTLHALVAILDLFASDLDLTIAVFNLLL